MAKPSATLYQGEFAPRPPKAEPLLPAAETNAYRTWVSPCGPGFEMLDVPSDGETTEMAANSSTVSGKINTASIDICTS